MQSLDYFSREISIPGIGPAGLQKLRESSVAIVGVGGVGSAAAYYLTRSGVGHLKLIDQDIVESTNLQRLHAATTKDLYHPKAEVIADGLSEEAEWCNIEPVIETITDQAHIALLNPPKTACLECIMPRVADRFVDSCETLGVSPSITGLTGSLGTGVALRFLLGNPNRWSDKLVTVDMAGPEFLLTRLARRHDCEGCGNSNVDRSRSDRLVTFLCGEHTANVLPLNDLTIELSKIGNNIPSDKILLSSVSVLVYRHGEFTVSLFRNGRFLIGGVENETQAAKMAREISKQVGLKT